jgi:hypothetical protein
MSEVIENAKASSALLADGPATDNLNMRTLAILVPFVLFYGAVTTSAADYYQLPNIKRIEPDLYRTGKVVIVTSACLHLTTGEEALLKYEGPGEYEIIWDDHSTCEVQRVLTLD